MKPRAFLRLRAHSLKGSSWRADSNIGLAIDVVRPDALVGAERCCGSRLGEVIEVDRNGKVERSVGGPDGRTAHAGRYQFETAVEVDAAGKLVSVVREIPWSAAGIAVAPPLGGQAGDRFHSKFWLSNVTGVEFETQDLLWERTTQSGPGKIIGDVRIAQGLRWARTVHM